MSVSCSLFFNIKDREKFVERHSQDIDLCIAEGYVNDFGINFESFSHQLCIYKLIDRFAERISTDFMCNYRDVLSTVDHSISPILVFNVQTLIGTINESGIIMLSATEIPKDKTLELIVHKMSGS